MVDEDGKRFPAAGMDDGVDADPAQASAVTNADDPTIEARLAAKALVADRHDHSGERSLGEMSRAERRRVLFGV